MLATRFGKERLETLPLFPTQRGTAVEKDSMVDTIECAAKQLGLEMRRADGLPRFTGHSLRVTGA
eukprot:1550542-Amphidinium_carterae.1